MTQVLDLSGNGLSDDACDALAEGLRRRDASAKPPTRFDLRGARGGGNGSARQISAAAARALLDAGARVGAPNDEWLLFEARDRASS